LTATPFARLSADRAAENRDDRAGREGGALGTLFAKAGHPVMFSSRHPSS